MRAPSASFCNVGRFLVGCILLGGLPVACGGETSPREGDGSDGDDSAGDDPGGGGPGGSTFEGNTFERPSPLPADCPEWEDGLENCQTCGGEYVGWFHRFPSELEPYLTSDEFEGTCPPPELVDFSAMGEKAPRIYLPMSEYVWDDETIECGYFVALDETWVEVCKDWKP